MSASERVETGRDRAALTREAGIGKLSFISVLAGVLVAYGAFAVLAALAAAAGLNTDLSANNWAELGVGSAIVAVVVLLLAYLFGGYVALGERWHTKLTRRAASPKYGPDRDQPTTDDHAAATPPREADDRDPAERDRAERGQSDGGGATRIDQHRPRP